MADSHTNNTKNAGYNTAGVLIYFFCQWLCIVMVVRLLGYDASGVFSIVVSFTNVFAALMLFGVRAYQISDTKDVFTNENYLAVRVIAMITACILFAISLILFEFALYTSLCCIAYLFFKLFEAMTDYYFALMQKNNYYKQIMISYALKGIVPVCVFLLTLILKSDLLCGIIAMTAAYFVMLFYDRHALHLQKIQKTDYMHSAVIIKKCIPIMLYSLVSPAMLFVTKYMVEHLYSYELLGVYNSYATVTVIISTLCGAIWAVYIPVISNHYQNKEYIEIKLLCAKSFLFILSVGIFVSMGCLAVGKFAFGLVFGAEILDYYYMLWPIIAASIFLTFSGFLSIALISIHKQNEMLLFNFLGAIVCVVTARPFTLNYGANGASFSLMAGVVAQILLLLLFLLRFLSPKHLTENH